MTDRTLFTVALLFASAVLLAGCDNNVDPPPSDVSTSDSTADSTTSADSSSTSTANREWENSGNDDGGPADKNGDNEAKPLVDVKLETIDKAGYQAALESHKGKVVLVDFWGTWCGPCREGFPHTLEIARKYNEEGLHVIALAIEYDLDLGQVGAKKFLTESRATSTQNFISNETDIEQSFENFNLNGEALPEYHLFDRKGKRIKVFSADDNDDSKTAWTHEDVETAVRAALKLSKQPE